MYKSSTPVLRSSPRFSSTANDDGRNDRSESTPTRKIPHCVKCGRPRAGHPRSGCPYADDGNDSTQLEERLELMNIKVSTPAIPASSRYRRRRSSPASLKAEATLASLSSSTNSILDNILQPGVLAEADDGTSHLQSLHLSTSSRTPRAVMPGSLMPHPQSQCNSFASSDEVALLSSCSSPPPTIPVTTKPLMRTLSMAEREAFLSELMTRSTAPPATVVSLALDDISSVQSDASKIGFHTRVLEPTQGASNERWLIVGRDRGAVENLYENTRAPTVGGMSRGLPLATSAFVGAASAVAALAFS